MATIAKEAAPLDMGVRIRLCIMMFLQYYIWGLWLPALAQFMGATEKGGIGLAADLQGWIFAVYGIGSIVGPFIIGALADRYFAAQKVLAFCHIIGGVLLIAAAYQTAFWPLFLILLAYCNLYMPTMGLTNSVAFRAIQERQNDFPFIRSFGTFGWILAGFSLTLYLRSKGNAAFESFFSIPWIGQPGFRDCLRIPGIVSIIYGFYCFALPHTPPAPNPEKLGTDKSAFVETLGLMKNFNFAVLVITAGLFGIMLAFYFACENNFLTAIGTTDTDIVSYMTLGQWAEFFLIWLVPLSVAKLGVKNTMLIGAAAWALRFGLSAVGQPWWLMISTIFLHGFAFGFFFVVAQMYVDRSANEDIKSSAQNLLVFVIYGLGTVVGSLIAGYMQKWFPLSQGEGVDWRYVWGVPFGVILLATAFFALAFREQKSIAASHNSGLE